MNRPSSAQPSKPSKRIVAVAACAALLCAFGVGAWCVSGGTAFDPRGLATSYENGTNDATSGWRTNATDESGDAANHNDQSKKDQKSAENTDDADSTQQANDAFSSENGGHVATRVVDSSSSDGNTSSTANGSSTGSDGSAVIVVPSEDGSGDSGTSKGDGKTDGNNGSNGGKKDDPGSKDDDGPSPSPTPTPTDNSYKVLPNDPTPSKNGSADTTFYPNKAGADGDEIEQADDSQITVQIGQADSQQLYYGQKLDAWTIFCSLSTTYFYKADDASTAEGYRWECTQAEFSSYPYFQIVSWADAEGNKNPATCPNSDLTITVRYRFSTDGAWHEQTVDYEPQASRVYILGQTRADGTATVLGWSELTTLNLLSLGGTQINFDESTTELGTSLTERALRDAGYVNDDDTITHLFKGWQEAGEQLGYLYEVEPGRHVIQPQGFSELGAGYTVHLQDYALRFGNEKTVYSSTLQTLVDVDESVLTGDGKSELTLTVPDGVEAVDDYKESKERTAAWSLSHIYLPSSVLYYNADGPFAVQTAYRVSSDNASYAATKSGILTNESGTAYIGVPSALTELDVPAKATSVAVQQTNELSRIAVHGKKDGTAPTLQTDNLRDCIIVIDDTAFDSFIEKNYDGLVVADSEGVTICRASDTQTQYTCSGGMVYSEDDLMRVHDNGSDTVFVQIPTNIKTGAFAGADGVTCMVLFNDEDCTLEKDSLAGGNVQTIVCFTEEQAAGVKKQLGRAGAPDAQVILAEASAEDMLYYVDGDRVTLLSDQGFASSFDGTVTGEDGTELEVDAIAPYAFAGDTDLAWVTLGPSVTSIGAYAFQNCSGLQGLFIGTDEAVAVGSGALDGCSSLGFVASLSTNAAFATAEVPSASCRWYCPNEREGGYDSRFSSINGVASMSVAAQADGSLLLYGSFDGSGAEDIVLAGGTSYNGTITLPSTVQEIFTGAFSGMGGTWNVDWSSAPDLTWIDSEAFASSGITGALSFVAAENGSNVLSIAKSAFENCPGITALSIEGHTVEIGSYAFANCGNLGSVEVEGTASNRIGTGAFVDCSSLTTIKLGTTDPASLTLDAPGVAFSFTGSEDGDEALELSVPAGSAESYLKSWIYYFVGYADYDDHYSKVSFDLTLELGHRPTEAQVRERMAEELLAPENHLRRMLGLAEVDSSTIIVNNTQAEGDYTFTKGDNGAFTLTSAPENATTVDLDSVAPDGCESLTIAANAFAACTELTRVDLGSKVSAIESGAFAGCDNVTVAAPSGRADAISLEGSSPDAPFTFGASIALEVPKSEQQAFLAAWPMRCLGFADSTALDDWALWDLLMQDEFSFDTDAVAAYVNGKLLEQENYLRGLMGLGAISSTGELAYAYSMSLDW